MSTQLILGTAGHIDHGKTALVKALTGIDTDRLEQEKQRGISIEIGFAHLDLEDHRLGIVDLPGHEKFIRNMLAGASGVDVAMLVIAADDSVMPQTREHLAILKLLRIPRGLVVITKTDLVEPSWVELVEEDVRTLVRGSFLQSAPIVQTSATTGAGIDELRTTLGELCDQADAATRGEFFRMAVDRSFVMQGLGTIITGTVWSGSAAVGDELQLLPAGKAIRIRGLQSHGRDVEAVERGQRAALQVSGAHHKEIVRGHEVATRDWLQPARRLTVRLDVLPDSPRPLTHRSRVRLHLGTQEVMAGVWLLQGTVVDPGECCFAQLNCAQSVSAIAHQPFVVRAESPVRTIGGGLVLQPVANRISRRDPTACERLTTLADSDDSRRAAAAMYFRAADQLEARDLCREASVSLDRAAQLIDELAANGTVIELAAGSRGAMLVHRDRLAEYRDHVLRAMRQLHEASPLESRIPRGRIEQKLSFLEARLIGAVVNRMLDESELSGDDISVALAKFKPKLSEAQRRVCQAVIEAYQSAAFSPPDPAELAAAHRMSERELHPIIELCVSQREIAHVGGSLYLHGSWETELRRRMTEELRAVDGLTVSQIRGVLETSRKYAVPICEYLDRIGLTRRVGDVRVLAQPSGAAASDGA